MLDRVAFAAERRPILTRAESEMLGSVKFALRRDRWDAVIRRASVLMRRIYRQDSGQRTSPAMRRAEAEFQRNLRRSLAQAEADFTTPTSFDVQAQRIATSIAAYAIATGTSAAAQDSEDEVVLVWLTMDDEAVRPTHAAADGQARRPGEKFDVGGVKMSRPGDVTVPIELWINCRCVLGIDLLSDTVGGFPVQDLNDQALLTTKDHMEVAMTDVAVEDVEVDEPVVDDISVPWHGVLAPEDTRSGDGRKFGKDALRWRDLPLPLSWQKVNAEGHDGSVVVGRIDEIWRDGNLVQAKGMFLSSLEAEEAIGLIAEGGIRGVSVDVDDATMQLEDEDGGVIEDMDALMAQDGTVVQNFTDGRICGATLCAIPAFMEAAVYLGEAGQENEALTAAGISEKPWDGSASRFTDDEWFRSTIVHTNGNSRVKSDNKFPIREPGGALSRAGVHAAASRLGSWDGPAEQKAAAKRALRGAYRQLGEDPPEGYVLDADEFEQDAILEYDADVEEFVKTEDGPGWLTHPVDTERLRRYWTKGKGAAKIRWGVPGDFNRCRVLLAQYVKPQHLSGYCANRHYDALGFWPGRPVSGDTHAFSTASVRLVEPLAVNTPPKDWFTDPHLVGPSPIVVTADRRVFGHIAAWDTCHIGFGDQQCVVAPPSATGYAYFLTGAVLTDDGDVPVGHLTIGTGHAEPDLTAMAAIRHYDHTGTVVADVAVGEDEFGIWCAGMVRPGASDESIHALRASAISGDWRSLGGSLELVAALAVNVPGFPIPRTTLAASGGRQTSLVATGIVAPMQHPSDATVEEIADRVLATLARRAARERMHLVAVESGRDPHSRMQALRASVTEGA